MKWSSLSVELSGPSAAALRPTRFRVLSGIGVGVGAELAMVAAATRSK
jgi:hypothetical protein